MSENVHYVGILKKLKPIDNETLEEQALRLCIENGFEDKDHIYGDYESAIECLIWGLEGKFIILTVSGKTKIIYEIIDKSDNLFFEDIFLATKNSDGTISFEIKYYNGGCGLDEALEDALSNMKG